MLIQQSKDFSPALVQLYPTAFADSFTKKLQEDEADSLPVADTLAVALHLYQQRSLYDHPAADHGR